MLGIYQEARYIPNNRYLLIEKLYLALGNLSKTS